MVVDSGEKLSHGNRRHHTENHVTSRTDHLQSLLTLGIPKCVYVDLWAFALSVVDIRCILEYRVYPAAVIRVGNVLEHGYLKPLGIFQIKIPHQHLDRFGYLELDLDGCSMRVNVWRSNRQVELAAGFLANGFACGNRV